MDFLNLVVDPDFVQRGLAVGSVVLALALTSATLAVLFGDDLVRSF